MENVLFQMTIYLAAAVIAVPLSQRLGFGSVLGYLAAGIVIGPVLHLVGAGESEDVRHYAEFGVVLMLFLIGLELRPMALWDMRKRLLGLGGLQVSLTTIAVAGLARALGLPWAEAVAVGMVLSLSSTAIVLQTLAEKKLVLTEGGRASLAVLLFQDLVAIPMLAIMPLLVTNVGTGAAAPHGAFADLPAGLRGLMVLGAGVAVIVAGRYLTGPFFRFVAMARAPEVQTAGALLFVAAIALGMFALGFSPALGTFLAGVVLAGSEYRHEIEADLGPFKGLLIGLFFITVGAAIDLGLLIREPLPVLGLTVGFIALKIAVLAPLGLAFGLNARGRLLFALGLAQAGEFGFFLLAYAAQIDLLPQVLVGRLLLVVSLSMMLTPALFLLQERIARMRAPGKEPEDAIDEPGTVIIAGLGRFGQIVNRMLRATGHKTVVIDNEPDVVARMRTFGMPAYFGDLDRPALLESAGIAQATALVIAIDDYAKAVRITDYVRRRHPQVRIIARARDRHNVYELHAAGVDEAVREVFDSAVRAGTYALASLGHKPEDVARIARTFVEHDRALLAELAAVWDPEVPPERNPAYVTRAREQAKIIAAALQGADAAAQVAPPVVEAAATPAPPKARDAAPEGLSARLGGPS